MESPGRHVGTWPCVGTKIYTADGEEITSIEIPGADAWDVDWHDNSLFVTECRTQAGRVFVYDGSWNLVRTIEVGYKGEGGIAVTDRYVYVCYIDWRELSLQTGHS